ncbi:MAG: hypothetical protein IH593_07835 [Bacteroidales bacterium]|nr:hypothetical protein [Bacteroidales bacterium]
MESVPKVEVEDPPFPELREGHEMEDWINLNMGVTKGLYIPDQSEKNSLLFEFAAPCVKTRLQEFIAFCLDGDGFAIH